MKDFYELTNAGMAKRLRQMLMGPTKGNVNKVYEILNMYADTEFKNKFDRKLFIEAYKFLKK